MSGPVTAADATARVESPVVGSAVLEVTESRVSEVGEFEVRRALPQHSGRMVGA